MLVDPLANVLTSIRNAGMRGLDTVSVTVNKHVLDVLQALHSHKCIGTITDYDNGTMAKCVKIELFYTKNNLHVIQQVQRVSRVSNRIYKDVKELKRLSYRFIDKLYLVSTSKGILSAQEAAKQNLGGEVLLFVSKIGQGV